MTDAEATPAHIGYESGCFCHNCCVRDNTPPMDDDPGPIATAPLLAKVDVEDIKRRIKDDA